MARVTKAHQAILDEARQNFAMAENAWKRNRDAYLDDLMFVCSNDQWDDEVRRRRGSDRPTLSINRLNAIKKQITGDYRKNEIAIKVRPVDSGADIEQAELRDGLIRNIQDVSRAGDAYVTALECAVSGGYGFIRIATDYFDDDDFEQDIKISRVMNPLNVYPDPFYTQAAGEDMRWCFETERMPKDEFIAKYPGKEPKDWEQEETAHGDSWYNKDGVMVANYWRVEMEKVTLVLLADGSRRHVTKEEYEELEPESIVQEKPVERRKVKCYRMAAHAILDEYDFPSKYIPIVIVPGEEVDIKGERVFRSAVHYSKDSQRAYNYHKTTATEAMALSPRSPWLATPKQVQGYEHIWAQANTGNYQILYYNPDSAAPGPPQRVNAPPVPSADIGMALGAADDIKATSGIYNASLGAQGNETSGVAIRARQQEGDNATFIFLDNLARSVQHVGTIINDMLPKVYDTERVIRVLGLDGNTDIVHVNRTVRVPGKLETIIENDLSVGKYDITITTGPSYATQRMEAASMLLEFMRVYPPAAPLIGDLVAMNMDWHGSDQMAKRLKVLLPPGVDDDEEAQGRQQQQMMMQQQQAQQVQMIQQAAMEMEAAKEQAKVQSTVAKAEADVVASEAKKAKAHAEMVKTQAMMVRSSAEMMRAQAQVAPLGLNMLASY